MESILGLSSKTREAICHVGEHDIAIELREDWTTVRFPDGEILNNARYLIRMFSVNDSARIQFYDIIHGAIGRESDAFKISVQDGQYTRKIPVVVLEADPRKKPKVIISAEVGHDAEFGNNILERIVDMIEEYALKKGMITGNTEYID